MTNLLRVQTSVLVRTAARVSRWHAAAVVLVLVAAVVTLQMFQLCVSWVNKLSINLFNNCPIQ